MGSIEERPHSRSQPRANPSQVGGDVCKDLWKTLIQTWSFHLPLVFPRCILSPCAFKKQDIFKRQFQPHRNREGQGSLDKVQSFKEELISLYASPRVVFSFLLVLPSPSVQRLPADGPVSRVNGGRPLCVRKLNVIELVLPKRNPTSKIPAGRRRVLTKQSKGSLYRINRAKKEKTIRSLVRNSS